MKDVLHVDLKILETLKSKMPHSVDAMDGLFFVGDSTISYGIGTDSSPHS